jgi:SAM-dependent methyltransferase
MRRSDGVTATPTPLIIAAAVLLQRDRACQAPKWLARCQDRGRICPTVLQRSSEVKVSTDYEYKGLIAEAWDVLRGDTSKWPDRPFYLQCIRERGEPVLDVGCATGRLLLDFLALGIDIEGVDVSTEMLAICRRKAERLGLAPTLQGQPMETLTLPRRYRIILVSSSSLQLVTDPSAADQAVTSLYEHLLPGGALVASFMTLWRPGEPLFTERETAAVRKEDGARFHRLARSWYDPETECERTEDRYQLLVDGEVTREEFHSRSPATRSYTQSQARNLFERNRFRPVAVYRGFALEPAGGDESPFIVVAER